jgi:hypothetical protein
MKRELGFRTKMAKKLPMVVDKPASVLNTRATATLPGMSLFSSQ